MFDHVIKDVQLTMFASMVRGIVLHYANHLKLLVTYGSLARSLETLPKGGQLAQALALITEDDHRAKRPLSTAVVVSNDREIPGSGFFTQCRSLGYHINRDDDAEWTFWKNQLDRMGVAPFTLETLVKGADNGSGIKTIQRPFVTSAVSKGIRTTTSIPEVPAVAELIRENAVEYGTTVPPKRRIVTPQAGVEDPKGPASGLPG